jgi:hypothetical protein
MVREWVESGYRTGRAGIGLGRESGYRMGREWVAYGVPHHQFYTVYGKFAWPF